MRTRRLGAVTALAAALAVALAAALASSAHPAVASTFDYSISDVGPAPAAVFKISDVGAAPTPGYDATGNPDNAPAAPQDLFKISDISPR